MLRFRLQELLAERQFQSGERLTLTDLATATGINRVTLSRMVNVRGYSTVTDTLDKLCGFFGCPIERLVEHIPEANAPAASAPPSKVPAAKTVGRGARQKKR